MISCVSHLLAQYCTSANFENNSFENNFFFAFFLMEILQTSYYYSYILKLSLYGFNYWMISVIIFRWLFKYRYLTILFSLILIVHYVLSINMVKGKFISLNKRGISNFRKRRTIFSWLRKQKPDVVFLQETHSTKRNEATWKKEWGATLFCSHGANNARGVAILIRNNFDCTVEESIVDSNGRFIILKASISGDPTLLVNIYAPNRDNELVTFYRSLLQTIATNNLDEIENIIVGGDFNCPLNPVVDKRGGSLIPRQSVISTIEQLQSELDLHDIWRIKNPTIRNFTWSQSNPLVFLRLDYWLISNSLSDNVYNVDMISAIKTDHSAITIEFQDVDDKVKGPGFWKLNCSLLNDKQYVNEVNLLLPAWLQKGKQQLSDPRSVWDWVKYNVKKYSRQYSMRESRQRKLEEWQLNREFQEASFVFQNNPSQENLSTLNVLKEKMEQMYDKKVEGIIIRSRARWYKHGEKNSKYFFNLEKRNHIRKHIRKLRLSGVITVDPFEILKGEKKFYENLYKSRRNCSDENELYFRLEDLPIPILSQDARSFGEGPISLAECSKIINSFPLNKAPGNDGLPIEFYKTFWNFLGEPLVECFNTSFVKGEMTPSQRQAVITLIEKKDQDRCDLQNWRPISLLNVDTKIASKIIAERMRSLLPKLIHYNQSGYIPGRNISENIRSVLDIMDFIKNWIIV